MGLQLSQPQVLEQPFGVRSIRAALTNLQEERHRRTWIGRAEQSLPLKEIVVAVLLRRPKELLEPPGQASLVPPLLPRQAAPRIDHRFAISVAALPERLHLKSRQGQRVAQLDRFLAVLAGPLVDLYSVS